MFIVLLPYLRKVFIVERTRASTRYACERFKLDTDLSRPRVLDCANVHAHSLPKERKREIAQRAIAIIVDFELWIGLLTFHVCKYRINLSTAGGRIVPL